MCRRAVSWWDPTRKQRAHTEIDLELNSTMAEGLPAGVEEPWTAGEFLIPACAAAAVALWLLRRRMSGA